MMSFPVWLHGPISFIGEGGVTVSGSMVLWRKSLSRGAVCPGGSARARNPVLDDVTGIAVLRSMT